GRAAGRGRAGGGGGPRTWSRPASAASRGRAAGAPAARGSARWRRGAPPWPARTARRAPGRRAARRSRRACAGSAVPSRGTWRRAARGASRGPWASSSGGGGAMDARHAAVDRTPPDEGAAQDLLRLAVGPEAEEHPGGTQLGGAGELHPAPVGGADLAQRHREDDDHGHDGEEQEGLEEEAGREWHVVYGWHGVHDVTSCCTGGARHVPRKRD